MPTTVNEIIARMNLERILAENTTRQEMAAKVIDYYNGIQEEYTKDILDQQFSDPKALKMQISCDNLTQFIADEVCRVFDDMPVLRCDDTAGQAAIDEITADGQLALVLKTAEVYAFLTNVCALHPWASMGKLRTAIIPSYRLWVAQSEEDPTAADVVVYSQSFRDTISFAPKTEYVHWEKDHHFIFDQNGRQWSPDPEKFPNMENPYGMIPFAFLRDQIAVDRFFPSISDYLINAQETLNVMLTELNQLIKMQAFSQPVMEGYTPGKNPIVVDPSRPIIMPPTLRDETQPKFSFVSPQARIAEVMDAIQRHIERTASRFGISGVTFRAETSMPSGYALKISMSRVDRRRRDNVPLARACLYQWWECVKRVWNYNRLGAEIPESAPLIVDFAEPKYDEDPGKLVVTRKANFELGLQSPIQAIMEDNPDIDEAEALKRFEANLAYWQSTKSRFGLRDVLAQTTTQQQGQ